MARFDFIKAAKVLADAAKLGDKAAAKKHGVTTRTVERYRARQKAKDGTKRPTVVELPTDPTAADSQSAQAVDPSGVSGKKKLRRGRGNRQRHVRDDIAEVERMERAERVFRLRRTQALSFRKIAARLGISHETARDDWDRYLKSRPTPDLDALRAEADETLREAIHWMRKGARTGDPAAARELTKAIAQHAKIFGYEAPKKHEISGPDGKPLPGPVSFAEIMSAMQANESSDVVVAPPALAATGTASEPEPLDPSPAVDDDAQRPARPEPA